MTAACPRCARRHATDAPCLAGVAVVCGGRAYADRPRVFHVLDRLAQRVVLGAIRHGACGWDAGRPGVGKLRGADALADDWAVMRDAGFERVAANWTLHGLAAGPIRNGEMLGTVPRPVCVVAFPGGAGTADCVRQAEVLGIRVWRVPARGGR